MKKKYREYSRLELSPNADQEFINTIFQRKPNQKGLSIAIPFIREEITKNELKPAIIDEYYYPIIKKRLVVDLDKEEINDLSILEEGKSKTQLIAEFITSPDASVKSLSLKDSYTENTRLESKLDEELKKIITSSFSSEDKEKRFIFIKFFLAIKKKSSEDLKGHLLLLIKEKDNEEDERFNFWRHNLLIKDAAERRNSSKKYSVIILVDDLDEAGNNELATLLRSLENPSHTKWQYRGEALNKDKGYKYIRQLVPFITQLPNKIITLLKNQALELDDNFFSDYFPEVNSIGKKSKLKDSGVETTKPEVGEDSPTNPHFIWKEDRERNGFIVSLSEKGKQRIAEKKSPRINIKVAYGTNQGNAFKKYEKLDFDFAYLNEKEIGCEIEAGEIVSSNGNTITGKIGDNNFTINIYGFDPDRELKTRIEIEE